MANFFQKLCETADASFLRFFLASLVGLVFDVTLAAMLHQLAHMSLMRSAIIALISASILMYFIHECWTFGSNNARHPSFARLSATVLSSIVALAVRTASLYGSSDLLGMEEQWAVLQLGIATGLSFTTNYLLVRRVISGTATVPRP